MVFQVLQVLAKQVKLVLEEKPIDFKVITQKMIEINYDKVVEKWQVRLKSYLY